MTGALLLALLAAAPARADVEPPQPPVEAGETVETPPPPRTRRGREAWDGFHRDHRSGRPSDDWFYELLGAEGKEAKPYVEYFARLLRQASRDPRAREMWGAYARRYRDDPEAFRGLGRASFEKKDYPSTVASFTRAINLGAQTPDVYLGRGLAADILGDHELAYADSQAASALAPNDGRAYALGRLTAGRPSSVRLDPATGTPELPPAKPAQAGPPPAQAPPAGGGAPSPGVVTVVSPTPAAAMSGDARRRLALGDSLGAIKSALAAVQADPKDAEAKNLLATAYEKTGRHAEAEAAATEALALAPDSVPALNTRAWARSGQRKFGDALADARRLLALAPDNAFGYAVQARALGGLGERQEMVDSLATAARLDGRFAELRGAAVRLPKDADTELLFGALAGTAPAAAPPAAPSSRRFNRFLVLLCLSLAGGLLVGVGLLQALGPSWRERLTGRVRKGSGHAPALSRAGDDAPPSFGDIEVKRLVASGGMGVVFEGWDPALKRKVALKRLRGEIAGDPKERARFIAEARTVAALEHPNIVRIHAVREDRGEPCLVFEFAEGRTLRDWVADKGPFSPGAAVALAADLVAGLSHAHERGFVHRDLKPENVMVPERGPAKLMDFGLARPPRAASSSTTVWGSPPYMSPEAEDGTATASGDLYALAAALYFALTAKPPFSGTPGAMSRAKGKGEFKAPSAIRPSLPKALDAFMTRALSPDPGARFPDAKSFHAALSKALA